MKFKLNINNIPRSGSILLILLVFSSCKKFIEIDLAKNLIDTEVVFKDDATATSAVTGIYHDLMNSSVFSSQLRLSGIAGFASDEFYQNVPDEVGAQFSNNDLDSRNPTLLDLWGTFYKVVYHSNVIIEGLNRPNGVSKAVSSQLLAEALLMRALGHFYLVNFFGDVPLILTTDYKQNSNAGRIGKDSVYRSIIQDLKLAQTGLAESYINGERFRPNRAAATAFLARVYLYNNDWINAEQAASMVIDDANYTLISELDQIFWKNSTESIWQFAPTITKRNTSEGYYFVITTTPINAPVLRIEFVNSFEEGDNRKTTWVSTFSNDDGIWFFPYKYKINDENALVSEYLSVFGLSEQYLIRAEARIQMENIEEGIGDINALRGKRRALPSITIPDPLPDIATTLSKEDALLAVEIERKFELFSEWGHRWFDLKRMGRSTVILSPIKGSSWQPSDTLFAIPQSEINKNVNLKPQNPGYN